MKALLALPLVLLAAASALAYGAGDVSRGVSGFSLALTEPGYLLLSGTALIAIAGAVRRLGL
jgi:hypothetical protein